MSKGWVLGGGEFTKALVRENRQLTGHGWKLAAEMQEVRESVWQEELAALLRKLRRRPEDLTSTGKSVDWKLAIAAALKTRTTVTNRWLATTLHMGNLHEVSRKVGAWSRQSDPALQPFDEPQAPRPDPVSALSRHTAPMDKPRTPVTNLIMAFGLGAIGLALAAGGIYVGETDDAPGAALLGFLLMTGLMVLAAGLARRKT